MFITGVNDTGQKLFSGVNDTGEKFMTPAINPCCEFVIAGVADTGDKFITCVIDIDDQLSAVTMTPAINLSLVTTTPVNNYRRWQRHRREIYCRWQEQGRHGGGELPRIGEVEEDKSAISPAADGVIGTAMKRCIHKHPTHLDQRPLRPPKLNNAVLVWSSFGRLRGLWSGRLRGLCAFSWLF